jgi:PBP1b-binding outer membrane lipoprotein LpoB
MYGKIRKVPKANAANPKFEFRNKKAITMAKKKVTLLPQSGRQQEAPSKGADNQKGFEFPL